MVALRDKYDGCCRLTVILQDAECLPGCLHGWRIPHGVPIEINQPGHLFHACSSKHLEHMCLWKTGDLENRLSTCMLEIYS